MLPQPIRLLRVRRPFDDPDWMHEIKHDGFRGLAVIEHGDCRLISRNGHTFTQWASLKREIARSVRCRSAVLDGEIACLDPDERSNFYALLFRRRAPFFCAFDLLMLDGDDLRHLPLLERKRRLLDVMPRIENPKPSSTTETTAPTTGNLLSNRRRCSDWSSEKSASGHDWS